MDTLGIPARNDCSKAQKTSNNKWPVVSPTQTVNQLTPPWWATVWCPRTVEKLLATEIIAATKVIPLAILCCRQHVSTCPGQP